METTFCQILITIDHTVVLCYFQTMETHGPEREQVKTTFIGDGYLWKNKKAMSLYMALFCLYVS